jgi:AraC-like DNA-binding protein
MQDPPSRISISLFRHIVNWLRQHRVDVYPLLKAEGLELEWIDQSDRSVPLAAYVAFFERAAASTGLPHLGLKIARMDDPRSLGVLGTLFMSAPSLIDALEYFSQNLHVLQENTLNRILLSDERAIIEYRILDAAIVHRRQDAEFSIAANATLVAIFSGGLLRPREVHFEHERVGAYLDYRDYFGCDVFFGQPSNALVFGREGFNVGNAISQPMLAGIISDHLDQIARSRHQEANLADTVRMLLGAGLASEDAVAERLGLSVSTLIRRLKAEGQSFREIAVMHRIVRAQRMLHATDRPIVDIALDTGYAESASFGRAFRKSVGMTPSRYRKLRAGYGRGFGAS